MAEKDVNKVNDGSLENTGEIGKEKIEEKTKQEITEELENKTKKVIIDVVFSLSTLYTIKIEKKPNGIVRFSANNKILQPKAEPEIDIFLKPNGKINFRINPYDNYYNFYFLAENLDSSVLSDEIKNTQEYLHTGILSKESKLQKEMLNMEDMENIEDTEYMKNPISAIDTKDYGIIPEWWTQAENDRLAIEARTLAGEEYKKNIGSAFNQVDFDKIVLDAGIAASAAYSVRIQNESKQKK